MRIIDMRSDTVSQPTPEMRRAIFEAEVGDDGYGEDPTVNRLQDKIAKMVNKEAALLATSGTQSNLLAVLSQTSPGDEVIVSSNAHMLWSEVGGASTIAGTLLRALPADQNGSMYINEIEQALKQNKSHYRKMTLLCLENTNTSCCGAIMTPDYISKVVEIAHRNGLRVHIDGARIFNAVAALNVPVAELVRDVDSVSICLSKGLGAPVGSLFCSNKETVEKATRWRKMIGGSMRQAGIIAAAGIVALDKMIDRIGDDNKNAKRLAEGVLKIPGMQVNLNQIQTNIVYFYSPTDISADELHKSLLKKGIKIGHAGANRYRACTHWMITEADIDFIIDSIRTIVTDLRVQNKKPID